MHSMRMESPLNQRLRWSPPDVVYTPIDVTSSWLLLDDNLLSGEIPPELGGIANLRILFLSDNRLSGEVPPEFGNLTNLSWLFLSGNELSGCMPDSLLGVPENDFLEFNPLPCSYGATEGSPEMDKAALVGGYVNRCVNDIRRRPSQPLIQWRFHPHTVHRDRRLRSTQGPSDA